MRYYRELLWEMTKRDIAIRYKGSWLGVFWSVLNPIIMLVIYGFVFEVIFKARWSVSEMGEVDYSALLFCGLVTHMFLSEVIMRSPQLIVQQSNYVKKVVFPIEIFSIVSAATAAFHFVLAFSVAFVYAQFHGGVFSHSILFFPVVLLMLMTFSSGISWFLSALGVYFSDVVYVSGFVVTALMFLSPIFYPASAVPESFQFVMSINPLTYYVETFRLIAIAGQWPDAESTLIAMVVAIGTCTLGRVFFERLRPSFADIL